MNKEEIISSIKIWHSSSKEACVISEMPFSRLVATTKYLERMCIEYPKAEFQGKYPKGTTFEILLEVFKRERVNRRLKKNLDLFV